MDKINTDLDSLKSAWNDMDTRLGRLESITVEAGRNAVSGRIRTAGGELARSYKRFMIVGLLMAVAFPMYLLCAELPSATSMADRVICAVTFALYFATAACMDAWLLQGVRSINPALMSVSEIIGKARKLKHMHHVFMCILLPFAIVCVVLMIYLLVDNIYMLAGIAVGGIVGLAVGLSLYFRMMREYREIMCDYRTDD